MRWVWVCEVWEGGRWHACSDAWITKSDGRIGLREWRERNPGSKFRLVRYEPKER